MDCSLKQIKITSGYAITSKVQAVDNKGLSLTGTGGTGITIANDGKVGIGTITAPTEKLEVNGNIKQAAGYKMNTQEIRALDANGLKLFNSAGNGIVINSSGNVGIGTSATSNRLEVSGTVHATSFTGSAWGMTDVYDCRWNENYSDIKNKAKMIITSNGNIKVQELEVKVNIWADHVFDNEYKLLSLKETEEFIVQNKHLPGIPSEKEVVDNGINVGEMNALLLQKIEELTLYIIEQEKRISILENEN
jgi:hypothetical protein